MSKRSKLTDAQIEAKLQAIPDWSHKDGKLHRELTFADFVTAFGFMTQVALLAESANHHPEWFNVYNRVTIDLATHDVGGISQHDFELAAGIDSVASRFA